MPDFSLVKIRTSPNWYIQWFENGHSRRSSTGTADGEEAKLVLSAFRLVQGEEAQPDLTVAQALDWYWETHGKTLMKAANAELAIRKLRPFFGNTLAVDCGIAKQQAYVDKRLAEGYGSESIRRDLAVLSAALRRAEKHTKIPRAPAMLTVKPNPPRERWLTRDEAAALFRQMRRPHRGKRFRHLILFARLALYTGARTGAILDLTWDRVRFDAGLIDYRVPGRRITKKARVISHMTPALRRMLLHAKKRARSKHVIEWAGQRIDRIAKAINSHADAAGIDGFSPHVLRHTFASWAVQKGVPIYAVGKALGQTVASTTERYAKLSPKDIAAVMEAVRRK